MEMRRAPAPAKTSPDSPPPLPPRAHPGTRNPAISNSDSPLAPLIATCEAHNEMDLINLATEEEGVGLLCGAWAGGRKDVLLMQSSGVGNCGNALAMKQGRWCATAQSGRPGTGAALLRLTVACGVNGDVCSPFGIGSLAGENPMKFRIEFCGA